MKREKRERKVGGREEGEEIKGNGGERVLLVYCGWKGDKTW